MKIAVTAKGDNLDAEVDSRFGRCEYLVIVDSENMKFETLKNDSATAMGGAGPQTAQTISKRGAEAVITGNVGPNAMQALEAAGIMVLTGASGTVREAMESFAKGGFKETKKATVGSHSGMR